jgi:cytochrome c553
MTRLVTFIAVLLAMAGVMFLAQYKSLPVNNDKFSYAEAKEAYHAKIAEREELERKRLARLAPKSEEEDVVVERGPLVELNTPQLVSGHDLYQRCIACHGREGEGRVGQSSPAIGGQHEWYILSSLRDMREGRRDNVVMNPFLRGLSDSDFEDLAAYISKLPWISER